MAARVRPAGVGRVGSRRNRGAVQGRIAPEPSNANSYQLTAEDPSHLDVQATRSGSAGFRGRALGTWRRGINFVMC